jgi:DNA repair exonuclease SbcCD ATPase subunit
MTQDASADPALAGTPPEAALRALGQAGQQALGVIRQATASGHSGAISAIEAVFLLSDALEELRDLGAVLPALLVAAEPGPAVEADLKARAGELAALAEQVAATRRELDLIKEREQATTVRLAELAGLRQQVDELRRRERLAAALHELNGQRQVVEQRLTLLRRLTEDQENAIGTSGEELITLAEDRRALLAARVRDTLARAALATRALSAEEERIRAQQEDLDEAQRQLAAAQQRQSELAAQRDSRLEQVAAHARADSALAVALSATGTATDPAGRLRSMLDDIIGQLDTVDAALRDRLTVGQAAYDREHAVLGWADQ